MKFVLSKYEREVIQKFKLSKYPSIYKTDMTDNILFLELVDFDFKKKKTQESLAEQVGEDSLCE